MSVISQEASPRRRMPFYGWVIVAAGFSAQMISSLSMQGLATYTTPLRAEFGWSLGETALGRSLQTSDTLLGPISGILVDRFGARIMMAAGTLLYFIAFTVLSLTSGLVEFYVACLLMGVANSLLGLLVVAQLINAWFVTRRATAMGCAVAGFAVSGFILLPFMVWTQAQFGWRATAMGTGIMIVLVGLPLMLMVRSMPEEMGLRPLGADPSTGEKGGHVGGLSLSEAMRGRNFWILTLAMSFSGVHQFALMVHFFPYVEGIDSRVMAGLIIALVNVFNLAGRLLGGIVGDMMPKGRFLALGAAGAGLGMMLLSASSGLAAAAVFAIVFGFSWGSRTAVSSALTGELFGRKAFGKIAGVSQVLVTITAIASPLVYGALVDMGVSYGVIFAGMAVCTLVAAWLFALLPRH
ncbi:MFS transporter [Devosia ginsengisoli]|uniref:MFS transporter n=2 Tax=Devosia ginsengisoli TaxID=400770 RepID=A0A5B8LZG9_9HYPH|nr:MFS transporter [Devosia ginsengisoli]